MSTMSTYGDECLVNNQSIGSWQLTQEQQSEVVWSRGPRANKTWSLVDTAGHFHAYSDVDSDHYPTLRTKTEKRPCGFSDHDPDCDGADETTYHCIICDEQIQPGLVYGEYATPIYGQVTWEVSITVPSSTSLDFSGAISIRGKVQETEVFGVAKIVEYTSNRDATTIKAVGISPLGVR